MRGRFRNRPIPKPKPRPQMPEARYHQKPVETPKQLADAFADLARLEAEAVTIQLGKEIVVFIAELLAAYVKGEEAELAKELAEEETML